MHETGPDPTTQQTKRLTSYYCHTACAITAITGWGVVFIPARPPNNTERNVVSDRRRCDIRLDNTTWSAEVHNTYTKHKCSKGHEQMRTTGVLAQTVSIICSWISVCCWWRHAGWDKRRCMPKSRQCHQSDIKVPTPLAPLARGCVCCRCGDVRS